MPTTILLVDDHPLFRKGLRLLLEEEEDMQVIGEAGDGQAATDRVRELSPDVVVMDITMPNLNGIEATRQIVSESPHTRVVALSIHSGKRFVEDMLGAGAAGYILKLSAPEDLVKGIRAVMRGEVYLSAGITGVVVSQYLKVLSGVQDPRETAKLTPKETETLQLIAEGHSTKQMAKVLQVRRETVQSTQRLIMKKLGVSDEAEIVEVARHKGLLDENGVSAHGHERDALPILRTKLHHPSLPSDVVPRLNLMARLDDLLDRPFTLVSAAAGYGKSTMAAMWLENWDGPSAWISLDEEENDLRMFLTYLVAAIRTIFPKACASTQSLIQGDALPPVSILSRYLLNDLVEINDPFILVLDDYHKISEKKVHDLIIALLEHPSRNMHLMLLTRRDPSLLTAAIHGRDYVNEIGISELRFTLAEVASFLKRATDVSIDDSATATIHEKIEGWAAGMRLISQSLKHRTNVGHLLKGLEGDFGTIVEYLVSEVLSAQPPEMAVAMVETAILDRFCASLYDALHGRDPRQGKDKIDGAEFIAWLRKDNLFLIALDLEDRWFRFHHLFQQLLKNQLDQQRSPEEISSLHQLASSWFEENGLIEEAIGHSLKGRDFEGAGRLVAQHGHGLIGEERVVDLERWLRQLPRETIEHNPMLLIFEAWIGRVRVNIPVIVEKLNRAEALLRVEPETGDMSDCLWGYVNSIRSFERYAMLDTEGALACSRRGIDLIPDKYGYMRSFSFVIHGATLQMKGLFREAVSIMESALENMALQGGYMQGIMLHSLSKICMMEASLLAQCNTAMRLLKMSERAGLRVFICWGQFNLACSQYLLNDLKAAKQTLTPFVEHRHILYPDTVSDCAAILSLTCQELNQPHEARHIADLLSEYAIETENTRLKVIGEALQAELDLRQGRLPEAFGWAQAFESRQLHAHYFFYLPELTLARVLVAEDTRDSMQRAQNLLLDIEKFSRVTHNFLILIPALALQAILLDKAADESAALERLEEAVSLAEPGRGIRFFLDQGPLMADLLKRLLRKNVTADHSRYIDGLLTHFTKDESEAVPSLHHPISPSPLVEPLTNRELEILELLAQRFQNKEISEKLFVSPETVKTHLKNIYQKLSVGNRREAVETAKQLGFI